MPDADPVFTLAALDSWTFSGTALAVLGHPIRHSLSPAMHNAALAVMAQRDARFSTWRYFRFEVPPDQLPEALDKLRARNFAGLNLTVPHKVIACDLVSSLDPAARPIGAVNTLVAAGDSWMGFNTDGHGLAAGILENLQVPLAGTDILLLGAGGAARGAAVECLRAGCHSLWIANRTASRLDALLADLRPLAGAIPVRGLALDERPGALPASLLVINTTSAGLADSDAAPVDLASLPRPRAVYDAVYNPPRTRLLRQAETLGISNANGLSMLVHQGARALALWTGAAVPVEAMRRAAEAVLAAPDRPAH